MATHGWGTEHSVAAWLFDEGHRFDFYQAVKLLELLQPDSTAVGEGAEPEKEAVRFTSKISMAFPATDVEAIQPPAHPGAPAAMTVNFLGLAGGLGPLPQPYTELILDRAWRQDTALRDFLDIFNHRLVSLLYRVRKKHHPGLDSTPPEHTALAHYLFALMGLGTRGMRGRLLVKDRTLLCYAGLLAQQPRSMAGLETLLTDYTGVQVKARQFCGRWQHLEADQVTTIGVSGQNQRLGESAVLGTRLWDQQGKFEICLGPLTLEQWLDLLPIGRGFDSVCELTRFYVGEALDFDLCLSLPTAAVPASRLGGVNGPRLGWTSWLKTRAGHADEAQMRLRPRALSPALQGVRIPLLAALPLEVFTEVVRQMTAHRFPKNAVVVRQGIPGHSLFVIRRGAVKVVHQEASDQEVLLATLQEGDVFGEASFLTEGPRTATIIAVEEADILELSRPVFEAVIGRYPGLEGVSDMVYEHAAALGRRRQTLQQTL